MGKFPIWWFDGFVWGIILIGMIPIGIIIYNIWLIAVLYSTYNCVSRSWYCPSCLCFTSKHHGTNKATIIENYIVRVNANGVSIFSSNASSLITVMNMSACLYKIK